MSVLKRIEEVYLGVLRFAIILVASILLMGALVMACLASFGLLGHGGESTRKDRVVSASDVTVSVVAKDQPEAPSVEGKTGTDAATEMYKAQADRAATAIAIFVEKHGMGVQSVDKERISSGLLGKIREHKEDAVAKEYADGLATSMEKSLADPKVVALIELNKVPSAPVQAVQSVDGELEEQVPPSPPKPSFRVSPIDVAQKTLIAFDRLFEKEIADREAAKAKAAMEELTRKASAQNQIYVAGGAFAAFLVLIFISIVVKIERNLRGVNSLNQ